MTHKTVSRVLMDARRIVVKVGSSLVTNEGRGLDDVAIGEWCRQLSVLVRGETGGLGRELISNDYDLKHVARLIMNSATYQRAITDAVSISLTASTASQPPRLRTFCQRPICM